MSGARLTSFGLTIDSIEPYIVRPGWAQRFYPKDAWLHADSVVSKDATTGEEQVWREPVTGCMMLAPRYDDTQDTTVAATTQSGGEWKDATGLWGQTCTFAHQTDSSESASSITGVSYEANQCLWLDLYFYEHTASDWLCQVSWGNGWRLDIQRTGEAQLFCTYMGTTELRARGRMTTGSQTIFGQHIRIGLFALKRSLVLVTSSLLPPEAGLAIEHRSPTAQAPISGDWTDPSEIWGSGACTVAGSDGAYIVGIRSVTYHEEGTWESPVARMYPLMETENGEGYTDSPTLGQDWVNPSGCSVLHTIVDENGDAFGAGVDVTKFRDKIAFTGTGGRTPHVFWTEVRSAVATADQGASEIDAGTWVQSVEETLSLDDHGHEVTVHFKPDVGELEGQHRWAMNLYCKMTTNGAPRSCFYARVPKWRQFERTDQLEWLNGPNRLAKLRRPMISDARVYDGIEHTTVVQELLETAGVVAADYSIDVDQLGRTLPEAVEDEAPLYRFANGTTVWEAIDHICKTFSGWHLWVDRSGVFHYGACDDDTSKATFLKGGSGSDNSFLQATNRVVMSYDTEVDDSQFYNQIWVVGEDEDGNVIVGFWQSDTWAQAANNYPAGQPDCTVGERRVLIYIDPALNTPTVVEATLDILKTNHGTPRYLATIRSGYDDDLLPGDYVTLDAMLWQIQTITTEITADGAFATYTLLYKGEWRKRNEED